jgi:Protein of unknown function (DUF2806)
VPVIHNVDAPEVEAAGMDFVALTHLTSIGLIEFGTLAAYGIKTPLTEIAPSYYGETYQLKSDGGQERRFHFGHVVLTAVGAELAKIAGAEGNDEYRKMALQMWNQQGWKEAGQAEAAPT